jgi:hypothetical protein
MPEAAGLHTGSSQERLPSKARLSKGHSTIAARALVAILMVTKAGLSEAGEFPHLVQN